MKIGNKVFELKYNYLNDDPEGKIDFLLDNKRIATIFNNGDLFVLVPNEPELICTKNLKHFKGAD